MPEQQFETRKQRKTCCNASCLKRRRILKLQSLEQDPQHLAAAFGRAVTAKSWSCADLIAKTGCRSLYNAFRQMVPKASMNDDSSRRLKGKISAPAFNKVMISLCGFECGRTRRKPIVSVAGNRLFIRRRWLNPQVEVDRLALEANYCTLCASFPWSEICSMSDFMGALTEICLQWNALSPVKDDTHPPEGPLQGPMSVCEEGHIEVSYLSSPNPVFSLTPFHSVSGLLTWQSEGTAGPLNGGQEVDLTLHRQWVYGRTSLWMDPGELERFASADGF